MKPNSETPNKRCNNDEAGLCPTPLPPIREISATNAGVSIGRYVNGNIQTTNIQITGNDIPALLDQLMPRKAVQIPYIRNANFTGRDSLLTALRSDLLVDGIKALTGLGGIGKTQLALEYSYRHQNDYDIVWWVRSEDPAMLLEDYTKMAASLGLPVESTKDLMELAGAIRSYLERHSRWLIVFDNVQKPEDLKLHLPRSDGHVIITSRNTNWGNLARMQPVSKFERAESVEFLLKRIGQDDRKAGDELSELLGDLPLALEQAGAYMATTGKSLSEYAKIFKEHRLKMLARSRPTDYPETIAKTWDISFQEVSRESLAGADLLHLFAYLAPEDIYISFFADYPSELPEHLATVLTDESACDEALAALRHFSLVAGMNGKYSIHRLVQEVIRDSLLSRDQTKWAEIALNLMRVEFPVDHQDIPLSWPECARILPHALAAAGYAESLGVGLGVASSLFNSVGRYMQTRGEPDEAETILMRALKLAEKVNGPDHPNVAIMAASLGSVLMEMSRLQEASSCFERALRINKKAYGPNHPKVAVDASNIGTILLELGKPQEARKCLERALQIGEVVNGPNHPDNAVMLNNLGSVLQVLREPQEARKCYERALKIDEKVYGPNHPKMATRLNSLGLVLQELRELQEAKRCFVRAGNINKKVLPEHHPRRAADANNLGFVLRCQGKLKGARKCHERALQIDEKVYGRDHPYVAIDINNLGLVFLAMGKFPEARKNFRMALDIFRRRLGEDHQNTRLVKINLEFLNFLGP